MTHSEADKRREAVLDYIRAYQKEYGYAPTRREIATGVGYSTTSAVQYAIDRLIADGKLRKGVGKSRALSIPKGVK